jgi:hypothetical protein
VSFTKKEIDEYIRKHGCFCGGDGKYTDYNCGASYLVTCPHCVGSGVRRCECEQPTLRCP